ncbi:hypothetical protein AAC387_Pa09g0841 [Persea americana]
MKEDDPETVMVCMTRAKCGRRSAKISTQSSNPIEGEESDNTSKGHETPVIDEDAPLTNKNTRGMASPVHVAVDDETSLTMQSLKGSLSPHTGLDKYSVFMAGEAGALVNAEEQAKGEDPVENI